MSYDATPLALVVVVCLLAVVLSVLALKRLTLGLRHFPLRRHQDHASGSAKKDQPS